MITQTTLTIDGIDYTVNVCDLSLPWIMIYNNTNVISCMNIVKTTESSKLESINNIFEANTKEECRNESIRLNLSGFDEVVDT